MHQEHIGIGAFADLGLRDFTLQGFFNAGEEFFAGGAGDDIDWPHIQIDQEFRQRDQLIRVAPQGHAFAVKVLVHIGDDVHQPAAFVFQCGGDIEAGNATKRIDKPVCSTQSDRQFEGLTGHFAFGVQLPGCGQGCGTAQRQGHLALAGTLDIRDGSAAFGIKFEYAGLRAIQHIGCVREQDDFCPHHGTDAFDFTHIRRFDPAGDNIDRLGLRSRLGKI